LADAKTVYWDSCVWLRLINDEDGADRCQAVLESAQRGELTIWTSSLTLAEVYKFKCAGPRALAEEQDAIFEQYMAAEFVIQVQVDHAVGTLSRRLCRAHAPLKKPNDGIHLASAVLNNVDEFHTFDRDDLLPLAGMVKRANGTTLDICEPQGPPPGWTAALR
jgi:predicted nucleic acid-binding protein